MKIEQQGGYWHKADKQLHIYKYAFNWLSNHTKKSPLESNKTFRHSREARQMNDQLWEPNYEKIA